MFAGAEAAVHDLALALRGEPGRVLRIMAGAHPTIRKATAISTTARMVPISPKSNTTRKISGALRFTRSSLMARFWLL